MDALLQYFPRWGEELGVPGATMLRLLGSLAVVVGYMVVLRLVRRVVVARVSQPSSRYTVIKASGYVLGVIALALFARIWVQGVTGFATYLGLLSAGVAVALQDPLINLAGFLFIVLRRPIEVGDRIQIGGLAGDVVDVRLLQFTLLEIGNWAGCDQSTGRIIHVPNGWVFKHTTANYTSGFGYIWNEISITVTFESDWRAAKHVLTRCVNDHAEHLTADATKRIDEAGARYHIRFAKLTPVVWTSVADSGVKLTMRYLCKPRERRASEHEMWEAILDELGKLPNVDFAYPTTRYYDNAVEGKPEAKVDARLSHLPSDAGVPHPPEARPR